VPALSPSTNAPVFQDSNRSLTLPVGTTKLQTRAHEMLTNRCILRQHGGPCYMDKVSMT